MNNSIRMSKDLFPENSPKKENTFLKLLKGIAKILHEIFLGFAVILEYAIIIGLVVFCLQTCSQNKETSTDNAAVVTNSTDVYITPFGEKYHTPQCRYSESAIKTTVSEAQEKGYTPCAICKPERN